LRQHAIAERIGTGIIITGAKTPVRIIHFERDGDFSLGVATGEGLAFRFAVGNATGRIELLQEKVGDEWLTVTGPPLVHLQRLIAVKMADEAWQHNEGPAMPTVVIAAEP
jgi:hypothetical protein